MNRMFPAALLCVLGAGCATKPVATTEEHRVGLSRTRYDEYVERRTHELARMGGPFANRAVAVSKAQDEARSRFGEPPPDVSTTWSWGKGAGRKQAQAEVNAALEKMNRDALRP